MKRDEIVGTVKRHPLFRRAISLVENDEQRARVEALLEAYVENIVTNVLSRAVVPASDKQTTEENGSISQPMTFEKEKSDDNAGE